jgi:polysaccharide biosynthesis protein PslH
VSASILAVTSQVPWPLDRGGHLRTYHLLRALAKHFRVRLVAGAGPHTIPSMAPFQDVGVVLCPVPLAARTFVGELPRIAAAAALGEPYVCFRRHDRTGMRDAVRLEITTDPPDILYLDHLDSMLFADLAPSTPKAIDLHNIYSKLMARTAQSSSGMRRWYLERESRLLDRIERRAAETADVLFSVSQEERDHFAALGARHAYLVANGVDCAAYVDLPAGQRQGPPIILYVGTLSWGPNVAAARCLVREILPRIRARIPGARVRLVGRDPTAEVVALQSEPGVELLPNVGDVRPHLRAAHVLAVPLESGGGSRLKILEAFAAGLPVVSTPVGAEGLDASSGEHLLIAPMSELADAVAKVLMDEALANRLAISARTLVAARYDWAEIGRAACDAVSTLVGGDRAAASKAGAARRDPA